LISQFTIYPTRRGGGDKGSRADWPLPRVPESAVFLPEDQELDGPLEAAIRESLPGGATYGVSTRDGRMWIRVIGPGDTREVLNAALSSLGRPRLD
jgi:hypothetical protein